MTDNKLAIIMVDGGFCSQLVKYALGEFLKQQLDVKVKYDVSWFKNNGMDCDGKFKRELVINKVFKDIDFEIATDEEIASVKAVNCFVNDNPYKFCSALLTQKFPLYIDGYYESIAYLKPVQNILYEKLNFANVELDNANKDMLAAIKACDYSCAVHIRRGDFVRLGLAFLTPEYYISAIKQVRKKQPDCCFFFFSNDIEYVKKDIIPQCSDIKYQIVDVNSNDTGYLDLYLISQCQAQISSNSSFGFWGAFLNQNSDKIFVFPSQWIPQDNILGYYASAAHYLPNSILLDKNGEQPVADIDSELQQEIVRARNNLQNYLIETDKNNKTNICAIYFSSNGIFYPKNLETFQSTIVQKNRFEWYKTRYEKASKHIFLRDINMSWYQDGISDSLDSIDKIVDILKKETAGYDIVCIGSSAGGYAALVFGCLLRAQKCFVSSPCFDVNQSIALNAKYIPQSEYSTQKYQKYTQKYGKYNDILPLINKTETKIYYIYPMFSDIDAPEYEKVKNLQNVKVLKYASDVHGQPFGHNLIKALLNTTRLDGIFGKTYFSENQIAKHFSPKELILYAYRQANPKRKWNWFVKKKFWKQFLAIWREIKNTELDSRKQ